MALFSDMLPYLLQQQVLPGGPNLGAPIAKSPNNVTAINMPSAKLPGTMDFFNAANNFSNVMGENMLRQQQAHLSNLQAQNLASQLALRPEFANYARSLTGQGQNTGAAPTGGGDVGSPVASGGGSYAGSGGTSSVTLPTGAVGEKFVPPQTIYEHAISLGATPGEATVLAAAPGTESGYDPTKTHDAEFLASRGLPPGRGFYGDNGDRLAEMQRQSGGVLTPPWQDQIKYNLGELRKQGYSDKINAATTPEQLAYIQRDWLKPALNTGTNGAIDSRIAYTKKVWDTYGPGAKSSQTAAVPQSPAPGEPNNIATPTPPAGQPEGANMVYDSASGGMVDATTGKPLSAIAAPGTSALPEVPTHNFGGTEPTEPEGDSSALQPGEAGAALVKQAQARANLSPVHRLNQALLAQLGGGQVAGDNAAPSGGMAPGSAISRAMSGQSPGSLAGRSPSLSAPFNPAAQTAASPSPAVPSAPQGGPKPLGPASPAAMPAAMPGGQPGFQMDPMQAKIIQLGIMGRLSGMGDIATPLEQAFYNSPAFAAQKALATGTVGKELNQKYDPGTAAATKAATAGVELNRLIQIRDGFPQGSANWNLFNNAVIKASGVNPQQEIRQGAGLVTQDANNNPQLAFSMPRLPEGVQATQGPNGTIGASVVPGALPAIQATSTAHAAGPATFEQKQFFGPFGQQFMGSGLDVPYSAQMFPRTAPTLPGTNLGVTPALSGGVTGQQAPPGTPAAGGGAPDQAAPAGAQAPAMFWNTKVPDNLKPFAAEPSFRVPTPTGEKDISQVSVLGDMFPNGQGITMPPVPPPGLGYGKSEPSQKDKDDVAVFQDQAQANQEVYQNLGHLYAVLQGGLKTGKVAPLWTDLTSIGKSLNVDISTPANDPENAGTFNKAATRLVFAALSKIKGQPRNMEITGLGQANPNLSLLPATNMSIVNDILSLGKWEDVRAKLGQQYLTSTGGAPLSDFTARFNQMAPLSGVTEHYKRTAQEAGVRFPGDQTQSSPTTIPLGRTATDPNTGHKIRNDGGTVIDLTTGRPLGQ